MVNQTTKPKSKSPAKPKSKKLKPASVTAQKAWQKFPAKLKKELRKSLPDTDKDKVPDGFDCRPRNKRRQESFLSTDATYLNSNPSIELGKCLGTGGIGEVFSIKGNRNLVVKVPKGYMRKADDPVNSRVAVLRWSQSIIKKEAALYNDYDLAGEPLFIPTAVVSIGRSQHVKDDIIGLVRPKVKPISDYVNEVKPQTLRKLTDKNIETIRRQLIALSHKGFAIGDGLQIGFDNAGRILLYDFGGTTKCEPDEAFAQNNAVWEAFLNYIKRGGFSKYGTINPSEHY